MRNYIAAFVLSLGLIGCTSTERADVRKQAQDAAEETRARTADTRRDVNAARLDYQARMEARLDKIDREMDEERAKARNLTAKQRREYKERMSELEQERKDARDKWSDLKASTDDNWEKFKDGLDRAADKVENGWNKFVADMKS
jgi:TolA-binding protein